jgi:hypothetical protein
MKIASKTTKTAKGARTLLFLAFACTLLAPVATARAAHDEANFNPEQVSWFRRHFGHFSWDETVAMCKTPRDVCAMVDRHLRYRREERDRWEPAEVTWETRNGDCEDFAICVMELCKALGFDCEIKLYFPPRGQGHAVAVGHNDDGTMWMSNLGSYDRVRDYDEVEEHMEAYLNCDSRRLWHSTVKQTDLAKFIRRDHNYAVANHN